MENAKGAQEGFFPFHDFLPPSLRRHRRSRRLPLGMAVSALLRDAVQVVAPALAELFEHGQIMLVVSAQGIGALAFRVRFMADAARVIIGPLGEIIFHDSDISAQRRDDLIGLPGIL